MSQAKIIELDDSNTCKICDNALAKYSCPKCNLQYCSLTCYQSSKHLECSEQFYQDCILQELSLDNNEDSKRKMLEILQRQHQAQESTDSDDLDSDDEDLGDITERLAGINLDNADQVWEKLTKDEQQEFIAFLKSGDVTKLIPSWEPWWSHQTKNIQEVKESEEFKKGCPSWVKIKDFKKISKRQPADCVKYNLINILAGYAFATRYFNGEHHDFCKEVVACIVAIATSLKINQNFEDFDTAVKSVECQCLESDWIVTDSENFKLLREDLDKILTGPNVTESKFYVLCALSDLHYLLNAAMKPKQKTKFSRTFPEDHFPDVKLESNNKIKSYLRKIDYLLSYAKDFPL